MWFWKMESNVDHKQHIFAKKEISHLPPTFAIIIHIPRPLHFDVPASPSHTSPRPILDVLKSLVSRPQIPSPHTRVPMSPSPCPRPTFIHSRETPTILVCNQGGTIRKVRGGDFRAAGIFFRYQIPCMNFFWLQNEYFSGLIGMHEIFKFNFPLCEYFFCTSPPPPL